VGVVRWCGPVVWSGGVVRVERGERRVRGLASGVMTVGPGDALFGQDGTSGDLSGPGPVDPIGPVIADPGPDTVWDAAPGPQPSIMEPRDAGAAGAVRESGSTGADRDAAVPGPARDSSAVRGTAAAGADRDAVALVLARDTSVLRDTGATRTPAAVRPAGSGAPVIVGSDPDAALRAAGRPGSPITTPPRGSLSAGSLSQGHLRPAPHRPAAPSRPEARPRVVDEVGIVGFSRRSRSRVGSKLFTLFFVFVFAVIFVQLVVALLNP
jgi:hypothetical protein